jgi:hypothetical protein
LYVQYIAFIFAAILVGRIGRISISNNYFYEYSMQLGDTRCALLNALRGIGVHHVQWDVGFEFVCQLTAAAVALSLIICERVGN